MFGLFASMVHAALPSHQWGKRRAGKNANSWGGALELGRSAELGGLQARLRLPTS